MGPYEVYTIGNAGMLRDMFNTVAAIMGNGSYITALTIVGLVGVFWSAVVIMITGSTDSYVKWMAVIAEFVDYNCIYCQRMLPAIGKAIANPNVNVVLVEFPILGESSRQYAKDALAAAKQDKYIEFHEARMTDKTADSAAIAQAIGLDMQKWETDRHEEKALNTRFAGALQIAQNLRVNGTPMFIIGDRVIRGAIPPAQLDQILARAAESVR